MNVIKDKLSSSSTKQPTKKETIFDHNMTEEERQRITKTKTKEEYLIKINNTADIIYDHLFLLYEDRFCDNKQKEDREIALKYFNKLSNKYALEHYSCLTCHPIFNS